VYESASGDLDSFFMKANELLGVKCEVIEKGSVYHLYFMECTCELCRKEYVSTPLLCECSVKAFFMFCIRYGKAEHFM